MFKGFICEHTNEKITPADCLACARAGAVANCPMSAPVIEGILANLRTDHLRDTGDWGLTITTLLGCPRKTRLKYERDYWLKPGELWWSYRGQLMHGVAAEYARKDPDALVEKRLAMSLDTVKITGQPDLVLLDRRHLVDYKTTKSVPGPWRTYVCPRTGMVLREGQFAARYPIYCPACDTRHAPKDIERRGPPRAYGSHVEQVSLYRLLLVENGIPVDTAEIIYQDMAAQLRLPVELLPLDAARALLRERVNLHIQPDLPGILTDPGDLWACDYCPVRDVCEELHGGPVGKAMLKNGD